jgi:hypothetical protein
VRRNDLGLFWLVTFADGAPERIEALPLKLEYCHTGTAQGSDADWIADRLERACAPFGTPVRREDARLVIDLR